MRGAIWGNFNIDNLRRNRHKSDFFSFTLAVSTKIAVISVCLVWFIGVMGQ